MLCCMYKLSLQIKYKQLWYLWTTLWSTKLLLTWHQWQINCCKIRGKQYKKNTMMNVIKVNTTAKYRTPIINHLSFGLLWSAQVQANWVDFLSYFLHLLIFLIQLPSHFLVHQSQLGVSVHKSITSQLYTTIGSSYSVIHVHLQKLDVHGMRVSFSSAEFLSMSVVSGNGAN